MTAQEYINAINEAETGEEMVRLWAELGTTGDKRMIKEVHASVDMYRVVPMLVDGCARSKTKDDI